MTKTKKDHPERRKGNDNPLSRNHSKSVRFRIRVQETKEAEQEIKEYDERYSPNPRVY